jgi:hypothetical protein
MAQQTKPKASRSSASRSSSTRRASSRSSRDSSNGKGVLETAKDATAEGASAAASTAKKLKTPAIAAGAGIAGIAGGLALARDRRKRVLGIKLPVTNATSKNLVRASKNLAGTAQQVGTTAERAGELAGEIRRVREALATDGQRRSPVEVLLEGLTTRHTMRH